MTRGESWLQGAVQALGGATALLVAFYAYQAVQDVLNGTAFFVRGEVAICALFGLISLLLLLAASVVAVPVRWNTGWRDALEKDSLSWKAGLAWLSRAYGRGARQGLGITAALAVLMLLFELLFMS